MTLTELSIKHGIEPEKEKALFTLRGKVVKEGDTVYSPYHGEGKVTNGFNYFYRQNYCSFEVLFLREHWNISFSHIYVNYQPEPDTLFWEPVPLIARPNMEDL